MAVAHLTALLALLVSNQPYTALLLSTLTHAHDAVLHGALTAYSVRIALDATDKAQGL